MKKRWSNAATDRTNTAMHDSDVAILIPAYKPDWFKQCLESCLDQTYPVKEIIISDDCPTDAIRQIVTPYLSDERIRYIRNSPSLGLAANYLQCARESNATWLKFFDDDDLLHPEGIARLMEHADDGISLVLGNCRLLQENGTTEDKPEPLQTRTDGMEFFLTTYRKVPLTLFSRMLVHRRVTDSLRNNDIPDQMISLDELIGLRACIDGDIAWTNEIVCEHRNFSGGFSRNADPEVLLNDLAYVTNPYEYASDSNAAPRSVLIRWRNRMVKRYARGVITKFIQKRDWQGLTTFIRLLHQRFGFLAIQCALSPRLIIKYCKKRFSGSH